MKDTSDNGRRSGDAQLPSLRFDTDDFRPQDRLEAMNEFSRGLYEYVSVHNSARLTGPTDGTPKLKLQAWPIGEVAAAAFENSPVYAEVTEDHSASIGDSLFLRIIRQGRVEAHSGNAQALLLPGQVHLMHARNRLLPTEIGSVVSLRFSYESVGYEPARHPRLMSFGADSGVGYVVNSTVLSLFEAMPEMTLREARRVEPALTGLLRGLLGSPREAESTQEALDTTRTSAMRRYVMDHLHEPDLGVPALQKVFNASRSTVYRAFEDVGGVAGYIRDQRLHAVYRDLADAMPERGAVRRIAERYTFTDPGNFLRAFRALHGVLPSEMVGSRYMLGAPGARPPEKPRLIDVPELASFWTGGGADQPSVDPGSTA